MISLINDGVVVFVTTKFYFISFISEGSVGSSSPARRQSQYSFYNPSAHRGVIRVYVSKGDRRGNDSPEERGEEEERRKS